MYSELFREIIKRSSKIPTSSILTHKNNSAVVRQLDSAIMSVGFKLSKDSIEYLSTLADEDIKKYVFNITKAIQELVGDHVSHNAYFIDFPKNVPDTVKFWKECIIDALNNPESAEKISNQLQTGIINLLDLPKYGKYQHSYEDLIAAHKQFIPIIEHSMTVLHLGKPIQEEVKNLYYSLAESIIPLNKTDLDLLQRLAKIHLMNSQPPSIPLRENKAVINQVRLHFNYALLVDTPTDILRLSCLLSDGDVTLLENTRFKSFPRKIRRKLLQELDNVIKKSSVKLGDINQYCEQWKRLGERLHVYEYNQWPYAQEVFTVAHKDTKVYSITGQIENAFMEGDISKSISLLSTFPGMFFRNLDRMLKLASIDETKILIDTLSKVISKVSTRIILSTKEHLQNRLVKGNKRVFINKKSTVWVTDEIRDPFSWVDIKKIFTIFSEELHNRTKPIKNLIVDKRILDVAIPLSNKNDPDGFIVMPRGSIMPITKRIQPDISFKILRFFIYWKQKLEKTDYDLSAIMLDEECQFINHLSYTDIKAYDGVHSGDITQAPNGASEFIDLDLTKTKCKYIIPSINIFSGENFVDVEESFFGFMQRIPEQKGMPFEPTTVKTKFDIRGKGKVALPLVFIRDGNRWIAKWLNVYLNGIPSMNNIESNRQTTTLLIKAIIERKYLYMDYLIAFMENKAKSFSWYQEQELKDTDTFVGIKVPEKLSKNTRVFTLNNLQNLLPT